MAKRVFFLVLRPFSSSSSFFCQTSNEMELSGWLLPSVSHLICYIALSTHIFLCNGQSKGQFLTGSIRQDDNYYKLISSIFYQILASAASVRSNLIHSAFDLVVLAQSYIISSRVIKKKHKTEQRIERLQIVTKIFRTALYEDEILCELVCNVQYF